MSSAVLTMPDDVVCSSDVVSPATKVLATITDYPSFLFALRARVAERQIAISSDEAAHVAGLSDRRLSQILSLRTLRNIGSVRRIGMTSLAPVLGLLGVQLLMVEDPEAIKRFCSRIKLRNSNLVHTSVVHHTQTIKFLKAIGKKGGRARMHTMDAKQRSASARNAARARWRKPKVARRRHIRKDADATAAKSAQ
jgi:hypothetical protein